MALASLAAGQVAGMLGFGLMAALAAFCFWLWRGEIELATRLLGVSAHGLVENGGVVTATILLNLASMLAITPLLVFLGACGEGGRVRGRSTRLHCCCGVPCICRDALNQFALRHPPMRPAAAGFAYMNGSPAPNPARQGAAKCVSPDGQEVLCCTWNPTPFATAYLGGCQQLAWVHTFHSWAVIARTRAPEYACPLILPASPPPAAIGSVAILWTMLLANQIRVFVTSGAIAQWYFAPPSALAAPRGTTLLSLKHAMGPSFGSLCLSSLVLTITQIVRDSLEK